MKNLILLTMILAIAVFAGGCPQAVEEKETVKNDNAAETTDSSAANEKKEDNEKTAAETAETGGKGAATPSEAVKTFAEGMKEKDADKVKSVLNAASLKLMEQAAQANNKMSFDEFIKSGEGAKAFPIEGEPSNEKIDGDKATVEAKSKGETAPVSLVKEGGGWKIAFDQLK